MGCPDQLGSSDAADILLVQPAGVVCQSRDPTRTRAGLRRPCIGGNGTEAQTVRIEPDQSLRDGPEPKVIIAGISGSNRTAKLIKKEA